MDTREKLLFCVREFDNNNEPISISKVARKCGVSHSLIYNRHPDIKQMINSLKQKQKDQALVEKQKDQTSKLLKRNNKLQRELAYSRSKNDPKTIAMLMEHIHIIYSMYDSLLEERNAFAQRVFELEKKNEVN
ncbi:hypothetical protein DA096_10415 [Vibrio rotiferianus]|jgi:AcrR family transcriptional regulator|uniref:hypothetical protein n=1 Tax=Vibrio rotiferianus TaxID=190895 RepID=UPI00110FFC69|nr:hypothetical protein [Vibrio rotiferianus]TMX33500.1 hypothetical protein DA095_17570 [Vibrio rotiferianus]TMX48229.1 hypothetical protein DA093_16870 [Vibrio rotiferianus]TMX61573.1 hypothetical protein DA097_15660 [Vibrio rotiferianus]TMX64168.1 hypothetical protein DA096_10415 [Vibrio rotiferianus]